MPSMVGQKEMVVTMNDTSATATAFLHTPAAGSARRVPCCTDGAACTTAAYVAAQHRGVQVALCQLEQERAPTVPQHCGAGADAMCVYQR